MNTLNEAQIQDLTAYLKSASGRYEPLREELLDHLACLVEEKMAAGLDYPTAKAEALQFFSKDEVKKTEGRTLYFVHTKPVLMKFFSILGLTAVLGLATLPFANQEKPLAEEQLSQIPEKPAFAEFVKLNDPPDIAPLSGQRPITASYGMRIHPIFKKKMLHHGVDFKAPPGTPIVATADGTVEFAGEQKNYGLKIIIQHDGQYKSLYAHMSEIKVSAGEKVEKGTIIGLVGSSGASTAPHLHYEILKNGKRVNPADYLPKS